MFKKAIIAGDSHGVELIPIVTSIISNLGVAIEVVDCDGLDYVDVTRRAIAKAKPDEALILICGTGVGDSMVANKFKGVRAVLAANLETAYYSRRHEDSNCLCLASMYDDGNVKISISELRLSGILKAFFTTEFEGDRHIARIKKYDKMGVRK